MSTSWLNYDANTDDEQDDNQRALAKIMSPVPAAQLVAPMQGISRPPSDPILTSSAPAMATPNMADRTVQANGQSYQIPAQNPDPNASLRPGGTNPQAQPGALTAAMPAMSQPNVVGPTQASAQPMQPAGTPQLQAPRKHGIWDTIGNILVPGAMQAATTTSLGEQRLAGIAQARAKAQADIADVNSQAAERTAQGQRAAAQASSSLPIEVTQAMHDVNPDLVVGQQLPRAGLARIVQAATTGRLRNTGQLDKQDDPDSFQAKNAQSLADVRKTQETLNQAKTDAANADPSTPAGKMAIDKLRAAESGHQAALTRAQASMMNAVAGNRGTDLQGNPLPGAMLTDGGQAVGSHFQANVRPTGTERGKADMAASAEEQLGDLKSIIQRHPKLFGPGYGQATAFRQWIGSQDPDAQRFVAARTIAGDHLAGTFGGRSEAALTALDNAIGQFKDNPKAAIAGIDQLTKANKRFKQAGTVHTVGGATKEPSASTPEVWVRKNGKLVKQ